MIDFKGWEALDLKGNGQADNKTRGQRCRHRATIRSRSRCVGAWIGLDEMSPKPVIVDRDEDSRL